MIVRIEVADQHLPAFLACMGIGALEAIKAGSLPVEAGIWSVTPIVVFAAPDLLALLPPEIAEVLGTCDELKLISEWLPDHYISTIDELITRLHQALEQIPDPIWRVGVRLVTDKYLPVAPNQYLSEDVNSRWVIDQFMGNPLLTP